SDSSHRSSNTCSACATEPASPSTRSERSSAPHPERCACACTGFSNSYDGGIPMTTDELELERDLKTLAEPRAGDERLHHAIRATLGQQRETQPRSRRRPRLAFGAAAVAAATAAAATVALLGTGGSGGPSSADAAILAHVTHTISPPANLIV